MRFPILLLMVFAVQVCSAAEPLTTLLQRCQAGRALWEQAFESAAVRVLSPDSSLTLLSIGGFSAPRADEAIVQQGRGGRRLDVSAATLTRLGTADCVWGEAQYANGTTYDVRWTETSDYAMLAPYVLGDPKGGDLQHEQYSLCGGYSSRMGQSLMGFELGYRALSEYRDRDPRPSNTVAHLKASASYGRRLTPATLAAASLRYARYKQTNELQYLNELGAAMEYHLTGVGNHFLRFSGASNNCFYKGDDVGLGLLVHHRLPTGLLSFGADYDYACREKILSDLNRLPLNDLRTRQLQLRLGWLSAGWGIEASFATEHRKGRDNLFGDATGNVYPQIGSRRQYSADGLQSALTGYWRTSCGPLAWGIEPSAAFGRHEERHADTSNSRDHSDLTWSLRGSCVWQKEHSALMGEAAFGARNSLGHGLTLGQVADDDLADALRLADLYMKEGTRSLSLGAGYVRAMGSSQTLGLHLSWHHEWYLAESTASRYEARITLTL